MVCLAIIRLRELNMPDKGKHQRWNIWTTRFSQFLPKWLLIYVCLRIFADFPALWAFHISHFVYMAQVDISIILFSYLVPETRAKQIANMRFRRPKKNKKKDKKYITNVAQQSDNTVVETWYGRRQESKAKTLLGSRLKIELRLDFLKIEVRLFFFENRSPIRFFFENRSRVRYFFSLYNLLSARRLYMNLE